MVTYKICFAEHINGVYQLRQVGIEYPTRKEAITFITGPTTLPDYEGVPLTILEIFVPDISN